MPRHCNRRKAESIIPTRAPVADSRQRRYGLDGKEIVIYKFRTMTVLEDGNVIKQATRNDRAR